MGCATGPSVIELDALRSAREAAHPSAGQWERDNDALVNVIPADATADQIVRSIDGAGVSIGLIEGFEARDLLIEAKVSYENSGAPGLIFRAQEESGVIHAMLMVVLNSDGIHLWELKEGTWEPIGRHIAPIAPATPHWLRAEIRGSDMAFFLDGQRVLSGTYGTVTTGGAGISGRAGLCRFYELRAESLD